MKKPALFRLAAVGLLTASVVTAHGGERGTGGGRIGDAGSVGKPVFLSPRALAVSPDGETLFVACEDAGVVLSLDTKTAKVICRLAVGPQPRGLTVDPHGKRLYASVWRENAVASIGIGAGGVLSLERKVDVGAGPMGLVTDGEGTYLYVANERSGDLSVVDLGTRTEVARLLAGNRPQRLALAPDGKRIYVTSLLSLPVPFRSPPRIELTEVDTFSRRVVARHFFEGANLGRGVAVSPDGDIVLLTLVRPKNLVPFTQLAQGWGATNAVGVILRERLTAGSAGRSSPSPVQLNIDQPQKFYADPHAVAFSRDGAMAFVASAGCDTISVLRSAALRTLAASAAAEDTEECADHLGLYRRFVTARIRVGHNPTALAVSPDGRFLYVAERLSDSISVIDIPSCASGRPVVTKVMELNPGTRETLVRRGQRLFHDACVSFQGQLSCASCHPDHHVDGLTYDLEPDGLGRNLVDNRSLLGIHGTSPFKWSGKNPDLATQAGPRAAKIIFRSTGFSPSDVVAVTAFLKSLPAFPPPRAGTHSEAVREQLDRGKTIFLRDRDNRGNPLAPEGRCVTCHPPPLFTNGQKFDVGTRGPLDASGLFDTPHLVGIGESAPYLHDGRAPTLEEIWTVFGNDDRHGVVSDLTKSQLNDLIEYMKSL